MSARLPHRRLSTPRGRLAGAVAVAAVVATSLLGAASPAGAAPDPSGTPITPSQYELVYADSESPAYPAPPALDGTALGAFDADYSTEWTSAYTVTDGVGHSTTPAPHWLTIDVGGTFTLTGLDYSVKKQRTGPVGDFKVFATSDRAVAEDPKADWGSPVAAGTFHSPLSNTEVQTALFDSPVKARYVKFEADSAINGDDITAASELRVRATGDTTPAPAEPEPPADPATPVTITNGTGLTVTVAKEFPQVIAYDLDGRRMSGQAAKLDTFRVNGTDHVATTTVAVEGDHAAYTSTFADLPGLTVSSTITATADDTVVFSVTDVAGSAASTVHELSVPDQSLVSVDSSSVGAQLARTKISTDSTTTADRFIAVNAATPVDSGPVGTPYGFVTNDQLSAGIVTNATDDSPQDSSTNWNTRLVSRIVDAGNGARRAELSPGTYTYAPKGATDPRVRTYELPRTTVVLAADENHDGAVSWQDAAIVYRTQMTHPLGASRVPERVVAHIPFNFASQATNPFLKGLDNVKRIAETTDGLGQWVLEKGYANEGHDSGHPDYGSDYNERAGGLDDLNALARDGGKYNADLAVHVNATEAYPQAKAFSEEMVAGQPNGWDWLNQSYHIDQPRDLGTGAIIDRFKELRTQAPGIKTVYIDAYYSSGWLADGLAQQLREMGFEVATEWAYKFEGSSVWSHWSNDKSYGGANNKGVNSDIVRFIANSDRDVWNTDPLLGGAQIVDFEGWTGHDDWNAFYANIWKSNLPTKFLQHFQLLSWDPGKKATLTGEVAVSMVDGTRQVTMGDAVVLRGGTYLLPWGDATDATDTTSPARADKMYYYNPAGGPATFTLTDQFAGTTDFTLYRLTDQGRQKVADVTAHDGRVTLTGDKATPYVLAPAGGSPAVPAAGYGAGSGVVDPGFNAGTLDKWGPTGGAHLVRSDTGDNAVELGSEDSQVAQQLKGLTPGARYTVMADIGIAEGQRRPVTLRVAGNGAHESRSFDITPLRNTMAADAKRDSYAQRVPLAFTAPRNGVVNLAVAAAAGSAPVTVDNVRLLKQGPVSVATPVTGADSVPAVVAGSQLVSENFEDNTPGWGPFVKGDAGGVTDPRTSISDRHDPYSQKTWKNTYRPYDSGTLAGRAVDDVLAGNHSLKSHEENTGLVYRTVPATVPFVAGHSYKVSFDYQSNVAGQWKWVVGADRVGGGQVTSKDVTDHAIEPSLDTRTFTDTFTAGCGDAWVGLRKTGGANGTDFVVDNLTITDLGPASGGATCASVEAPATSELSPGTANQVVTTFTNNEDTDATNVALSLGPLPAGWKVEVARPDGNLFATVKPGQSVSTTWLVTPPAEAKGTSVDLRPTGTYFNQCVTKSAATSTTFVVATRAMVPTGSMTATADSQEQYAGPSEGPVENVLDGDLGTIWHTQYNPTVTPYPHWVQLDLHGTYTVDGFGYQDRQSGGPNGRVKDYKVFVSTDGATWTQVASGSLVDQPAMQVVDFSPVQAKYVKFEAENALNGQPFAAAAEMRVYGSSSASASGYPPAPRPADTACTP